MGGKIRTEPVVVKAPSKPSCPIHHVEMTYEPDRLHWTCLSDGCRQIAFPPEEVEHGKPVMGKGIVELLRMKDPDGSKEGRYILRTLENNVMIDVTDVVVKTSGKHLTLYIDHVADIR